MKTISLLTIGLFFVLIPIEYLKLPPKKIYEGGGSSVFVGSDMVLAEIRYTELELDWNVPLRHVVSMQPNGPLLNFHMDDATASTLFYLFRFWSMLSRDEKGHFFTFFNENSSSESHRQLAAMLFSRLEMCFDDIHLNTSLHQLMPRDKVFSANLIKQICSNEV